MKILLAGLGSIGRRHLQNLLALGERDIVIYRSGRSTLPDHELVQLTAGLKVETDLATALAHQPQAVVIANPTALHLQVAIPAARQGCHILLEKPVSHSAEGVEELYETAEYSGSRVLVGYHFRFHPGLQRVAALLREGRIGRLLSLRAHWGEYLPGWHPWEDYRQGYSARQDLGGGVVLTLSHPLDYLLWLAGESRPGMKLESYLLWACTTRLGDLELDVEDTAELVLEFVGDEVSPGVLASLHLDYTQRPPAHWLQAYGTDGWLHWDAAEGAVTLSAGTVNPAGTGPGVSRYALPADFTRNDLFLEEMRHFLAVARGEAEPVCSLADGIRVLELALQALAAR